MRSQSADASPQDISACVFRYECVFRGSLCGAKPDKPTHRHAFILAAPPPHTSVTLRIYIKRGMQRTSSGLIKVPQC